jgi:Na+/proline symporter
MSETLSPGLIAGLIAAYFVMLITVSYFTSRNASNNTFFLAGRNSPWILVAIGMIGTSISGVTFISIPGVVGAGSYNQAYSYMQLVLGNLLGYIIIATVLLPLYYRLNLTSIYTYLEQRLGNNSYKIGAAYFLLSRTIGSSFRLFLAAAIVDQFVTSQLGIPFWATVLITVGLIWVYTFKGGIQTIIYTDTLQTFFLLSALVLSVISISQALHLGLTDIIPTIQHSPYSQMFFFKGGWSDPNNFFKQFISGALIAIAMTGLDQDLMQKNLTCRTIQDAQKNMFVFCSIFVFINLLFLSLGAMLYIYAAKEGIELPLKPDGKINSDLVYPTLALNHMSIWTGILFMLGIIACTYASADSALTALTTSFCIDFLNFNKTDIPEAKKERTRIWVHLGFSALIFVQIVIFKLINDDAVISKLFKLAGYTYGPLLGLFSFGLLTKRSINDRLAIPVCLAAPVISYIIDNNSKAWLNGFTFGVLIIAVNGLITFLGLMLISKKRS